MNPNAINGLMKALKVLESSGGSMDLDQMWNKSFPIPGPQGNAKTGQETASTQMLLRTEMDSSRNELNDILDGLCSLTSSLQKKITSLKAVYEPLLLSHWMNTAPVEILNNIFEMACSGSRQAAWNLSQVNKRFYNIATRNPRLWNNLSNFDTEDSCKELRVSLERSKNIELNVVMNFRRFETTSGVDVLEIASLDTSRWESVVYWMSLHMDLYWQELFEEIYDYSVDLDLPRLKDATIHFPREDQFSRGIENDFIDHSDPLMHFYSTWFVPNLTKLKVYNLFPLPSSRSAPPLTTLELVVNEGAVDYRSYDMNLLLDFLRSCPLLETLSLTFSRFSLAPSTGHDFTCALPDLVLPNLRTFRFILIFVRSWFLLPFTNALHFPLLSELHAYDDGSLDEVFPLSQENHTNVEVLNYRIRIARDHEFCYYTFVRLFKTLPNLRSLTVDSERILQCIDEWSPQVKLPKLEDIHFVGCIDSDHLPLELFRKLLEEQDKWDTLKEVTFTECNNLDEEAVSGIFQGKMVTWNSERMEQYQLAQDLDFWL